jgi:acetoin utilization protein AcuC
LLLVSFRWLNPRKKQPTHNLKPINREQPGIDCRAALLKTRMNDKNAVFVYSSRFEEIGYPPDCPFNSHRAAMTRKAITSMGLLNGRERREILPVPATRAELEKFHTSRYLDAMLQAEFGDLPASSFLMGLGSPENPVFKGMTEHAALACGASLTGAMMILAGEARIAFNPSGGFHHAGPEKASGFCYLNDVVLAIMSMTDASKRVLFLDLDVHHCDAVQNAFFDRSDVLTVSLHESGKTLFPGTGFAEEIGIGAGKGYSVNIPLPQGTYDEAYEHVFQQVVVPIARKYDPDIIILELGMDALSNDPLAHLNLTNNAHAEIISSILKMEKPILATGGGGYHVKNTVRGWTLAWAILSGEEEHNLNLGMGGVMLENIEWPGGLRDRILPTDVNLKRFVDAEISRVTEKIKSEIFPIHGIES